MSLYAHLIESFARSGEPESPALLKDRPLVVFGPQSLLGNMHLRYLLDQGASIILGVDDYTSKESVEGIPIVKSAQLIERAGSFPANTLMVDFSLSLFANGFCRHLARHAGLELRDVFQVLACFNSVAVYEKIRDYRSNTLARADDWLKLAPRLGDDHSRETLYGVLLQRLEYDRRWMNDIRISPRDEYFGLAGESNTFTLGNREHFVDCGAHRGTILHKLFGVTGWNYASLHAFEPDAENFQALQQLAPWKLEQFHAHNYAVSDQTQTLRFHQTGTMGSHISDQGDVSIRCVTVDDWVERATFMKFDVEGFEARALQGSKRLLAENRPRLAVASYHYATDLLDIAQTIDELAPGYTFFLRHHAGYFYDTMLYATPRGDWLPGTDAA
ncbi:FkbM family methyltransferase [Delftia tsuruhatensis]|uniref:FkbM family methyltransferase n=1 Tax=Delftia tsuruhatensis TaxID=180282 RepID=UPI00209025C1|nr:FkbM family methyltransferase [Delftia tsuruhatensis]MCO5339406.1 FkbM family methyltransferase [Delftia tsuruhatensis]MCR4547028.1 FkbM family methyltransferase [Delftia tsuruhatensis]